MELTREQRQYIVEVLADIWGREHGVKLKANLPPDPEDTEAGGETAGQAQAK